MEKVRNQLKVHQERAVLVGAVLRGDSKTNNDDVLQELTALAESAGAVVVDRFIQKLNRVNPATYIGSGKAQMLADRVRIKEGDVVEVDLAGGRVQARCLKRQLSLPVSTMSQWCVRRSSSAVVIFASPKTVGHSAKARLVVTMIEVRS